MPFNSKILIFCDITFVSSARDDIEGIDNGSTYDVKDVESFARAKISAISVSFEFPPMVRSPLLMFWLEKKKSFSSLNRVESLNRNHSFFDVLTTTSLT